MVASMDLALNQQVEFLRVLGLLHEPNTGVRKNPVSIPSIVVPISIIEHTRRPKSIIEEKKTEDVGSESIPEPRKPKITARSTSQPLNMTDRKKNSQILLPKSSAQKLKKEEKQVKVKAVPATKVEETSECPEKIYKRYSPKVFEMSLDLVREGLSALIVVKKLDIPVRTLYHSLKESGINVRTVAKAKGSQKEKNK